MVYETDVPSRATTPIQGEVRNSAVSEQLPALPVTIRFGFGEV